MLDAYLTLRGNRRGGGGGGGKREKWQARLDTLDSSDSKQTFGVNDTRAGMKREETTIDYDPPTTRDGRSIIIDRRRSDAAFNRLYARIALRATERPLSPLTRRQAIRLIQTSVPTPTSLGHRCSASLTLCFSLFRPFTEITEPLYNVGPGSPRGRAYHHRDETHKPRNSARSRVFYSIYAMLYTDGARSSDEFHRKD